MVEEQKQDHISVCICTFKRPEMVADAIAAVSQQVTEDQFTFEIVVVDNDEQRSAQKVVEHCDLGSAIIYVCEPIQNIALARNLAIRTAAGNLIAFLDDDEKPIDHWLLEMYATLKKYSADGVLGPVLPHFPSEAPAWIKKAYIYRKRFKTGIRLTSNRDTRTGNVLMAREIMPAEGPWFDSAFGLTGGEDVNFFGRQMALGRAFVWCDEAEVYETVPLERWSTHYHVEKSSKVAALSGKTLRENGLSGLWIFTKSSISIFVRSLTLLLLLPFGKDFWLPQLLKLVYATSFCLSYIGVSRDVRRY